MNYTDWMPYSLVHTSKEISIHSFSNFLKARKMKEGDKFDNAAVPADGDKEVVQGNNTDETRTSNLTTSNTTIWRDFVEDENLKLSMRLMASHPGVEYDNEEQQRPTLTTICGEFVVDDGTTLSDRVPISRGIDVERQHSLQDSLVAIQSTIMPLPTSELLTGAARRDQTLPGAVAILPFRVIRTPETEAVQRNTSNTTSTSTSTRRRHNIIINEAVVVTTGEELFAISHQETETQIASVCQETPEAEVFDGKVLQEKMKKNTNQCIFGLGLVLCLIVVVVVAVLTALIISGKTSKEKNLEFSSPQSQQEADSTNYSLFQEGLPFAAIKVIEEVGSPYYLANIWMRKDENLNSYSKLRQRQRFILASLYYGTGGDSWFQNDNWLSYDISECDWYYQTSDEEMQGIPVCDENDNLLSLGVASNNLQGIFPVLTPFLSQPFLPHIRAVDISHNNLSGVTPALYATDKIEVMIFSNNSFHRISPVSGGKVPGEVRVLKCNSNVIGGATLRGLALLFMPKLEVYNLTENRFDGIISPNFKFCKNLTYLGLGHNFLSSTLPSELGLLTAITGVDVAGNAELGGTVPSELGSLFRLRHLDLRETNITGQLGSLCDSMDIGAATNVFANCTLIQCCGR